VHPFARSLRQEHRARDRHGARRGRDHPRSRWPLAGDPD
jgi:hypothetical protein